ncbi:unnamed protein product [Allacma fusca]|uniref:Uncharacterized protein n=1 Tax=Allacma fusca TaxID=39272 RepID=A0A8J2PL21_9HEXA|nr:unnamed protein product [Allacma fusca]
MRSGIQNKMSGIKRTPANSNLSQNGVNVSYGILTRPATPGSPLRSVNNSTNLEDLSHHFRRLSTRTDAKHGSNSNSSFTGAGDETFNFQSENCKCQRIEKPIEGQNGAESQPLERNDQSPERTPAITDFSKVHEVQSTAIKVAYFDPVESSKPKRVQNRHARACEVQGNDNIDDDEFSSSELRDELEEEEFTPQSPCNPIPVNEKSFYTLDNAQLCPELRKPVLNSKNITPLFQPMAAPPLAVSMNVRPPNPPESAYASCNTGLDTVCNPQTDQRGNQNCNPSSIQGSHPQKGRPATQVNQMTAPNPNSFPNLGTESGYRCPRPQSQMQRENFIGQIPAIYPQVPPSAWSPNNNNNSTNYCPPGFSTSGYGGLRKATTYPPNPDCQRKFTAYSQSFSRAQTAPGFQIYQMPGQGNLTVPPRTAQNMLYQMGLARPPTGTTLTAPLDSYTTNCSASMPEQAPRETPVPGPVPGTENPYGHFSNNCNFFIYNVPPGMVNGWEPSETMLNPENDTGIDYTLHGVAAGQGFEGPKFYKPNLYPIPRYIS